MLLYELQNALHREGVFFIMTWLLTVAKSSYMADMDINNKKATIPDAG